MSQLAETFAKKMAQGMGKVHDLGALKKVPGKVLELAENIGVDPKAVAMATKDLKKLKWGKIGVEFRNAKIFDVLGISEARFGIAETGTLVFAASKGTPASLNFVPEYSIVVLRKADILENSEAVWAAFAKEGRLPNSLNLVSGPSKTGDIEQTLFLGAHGPRELHVLLI